MRTLDEIEEDLRMCEQYIRTGTPQAALKFCTDLRFNLLDLVQHIRELQGREAPVLLSPEERDDE